MESPPYLSVVAAERSPSTTGFVDGWNSRTGAEVILVADTAVACNAGIRRARGEFILATHTGIACSDELAALIASRSLQHDRMYRADVLDDAASLWTREGIFPLTPDGLRRNHAADITPPQSAIHFDRGWFPRERDYRWMGDDAWLVFTRPEGGVLQLEVEPGPALVQGPYRLEAASESGEGLAVWEIAGSAVIELVVPAGGDAPRVIRLRSRGGVRPLPDDPRPLCYRVFRVDWASLPPLEPVAASHRATLIRMAAMNRGPGGLLRAARLLGRRGADIGEAGMEFRCGAGWHYLEYAAGERFRWAELRAELAVRSAPAQRSLAFVAEPGPSIGYLPFILQVWQRGGELLGRIAVRGVTYAEIPIPTGGGNMLLLDLVADTTATVSSDDPRTLAFRVFALGGGAALSAPAQSAPSRCVPGPWPAAVVQSSPAAIDGETRTAPFVQQIAALGSPPFLHLHGCDSFVLMAREHWEDVRGFPELASLPQALLCYAAHYAGVREEVLRAPVVSAGNASAPQPLSADALALMAQMRYLNCPVILNGPGWVIR